LFISAQSEDQHRASTTVQYQVVVDPTDLDACLAVLESPPRLLETSQLSVGHLSFDESGTVALSQDEEVVQEQEVEEQEQEQQHQQQQEQFQQWQDQRQDQRHNVTPTRILVPENSSCPPLSLSTFLSARHPPPVRSQEAGSQPTQATHGGPTAARQQSAASQPSLALTGSTSFPLPTAATADAEIPLYGATGSALGRRGGQERGGGQAAAAAAGRRPRQRRAVSAIQGQYYQDRSELEATVLERISGARREAANAEKALNEVALAAAKEEAATRKEIQLLQKEREVVELENVKIKRAKLEAENINAQMKKKITIAQYNQVIGTHLPLYDLPPM
jgi:hypothetical protein